MAPAATPQTQETQDNDAFLKSMPLENVAPLWHILKDLSPPKPKPTSVPHLWNYKKLKPILDESGRLVPTELAERRVLMLVNPKLTGPRTTETLYAGLQYIKPGEVAPAHRHVAFAFRFILEGQGGFTNVEGTRMTMKRGDVLLTPRNCWHDHGKDGSGPMIWLDGLDLPIFQTIPVNYTNHYEEDRFPAVDNDNTPMKFPWQPVQDKLDSIKGDYAIFEYRDQENPEKFVSSILGAEALRISPNASTPVRQENSSFVFCVYEGKGHTIVYGDDGEENVLNWENSDVFCIPCNMPFKHFNDSSNEQAYLFNFSDTPLLKNLNIHSSDLEVKN
ncbi:predicted protein [Scheffersomyces stipitis CBS 6054]|uniref:Cupin type-2 domain-containing protein n=1 Tax=Scheffersomyces stipitis (strain ATCC 58785 / CBS 6054 / NBRC 10063 / NRRL Y-11545) TaxID=322104 RepID=A3LPN2_PICST|nr:predicted protein [Scheffersomyces stipitis CBS 6054]ABN65070.1 predicted protein [Scheffersomyces stipitis CBS 6054]KAG2736949.1 hypothetical protein G9P44_001039 [Scheffersomyces stipitis]